MQTEKLTLEHLAPYLPYGLKMRFNDTTGREITLTGITDHDKYGVSITGGYGGMWLQSCDFKPMLRPLSSLTKEITHNGTDVVLLEYLMKVYYRRVIKQKISFTDIKRLLINGAIDELPNWLISYLYKYHFDVFGLIESDLALPIKD